MAKIKLIDISKEKPVKIGNIKKESLSETELFKQKEIIVNTDKLSPLYTIFYLEELSEKYLLTYEEILTMLYLYELGLFKLTVKVIHANIYVSNYLKLGYIVKDFKHKRIQLYKLSDKGFNVVNDFFKLSENRNSYLSYNRQTGVDTEGKLKSTLSNYFKKD